MEAALVGMSTQTLLTSMAAVAFVAVSTVVVYQQMKSETTDSTQKNVEAAIVEGVIANAAAGSHVAAGILEGAVSTQQGASAAAGSQSVAEAEAERLRAEAAKKITQTPKVPEVTAEEQAARDAIKRDRGNLFGNSASSAFAAHKLKSSGPSMAKLDEIQGIKTKNALIAQKIKEAEDKGEAYTGPQLIPEPEGAVPVKKKETMLEQLAREKAERAAAKAAKAAAAAKAGGGTRKGTKRRKSKRKISKTKRRH